MKKTALLIMAAGIGSRFGEGIKQLTPVDPWNHIIMDYSIYDAVEAGFNQIVFIIRKDIEADFKEIIGNRIEAFCKEKSVEVGYVFQSLDDIPGMLPSERTKPWGTGQAVLAARKLVRCPFAVLNADDYYGREAFVLLHDWLIMDHADHAVSMAGFILKNTLSEHGGVTRGVCRMTEGHTHILDVVETKNIVKTPEGPMADGELLDPDTYVSMNMWGFPSEEGREPAFFQVLEEHFRTFFETEAVAEPLTSEYLLPTLIGNLLRTEGYTVKVLPTSDQWFGVTFREDQAYVIENFKMLNDQKLYQW